MQLCSMYKTIHQIRPQKKCHQYWENELLKPYEPGRGLEVTVTSVKGYANYDVREITLSNVRNSADSALCLLQAGYISVAIGH